MDLLFEFAGLERNEPEITKGKPEPKAIIPEEDSCERIRGDGITSVTSHITINRWHYRENKKSH